jgi:hypothetical protein
VSLFDWNEWRLDSFVGKRWAAFAEIAVHEEAIYITCNMFNTLSPDDKNSILRIILKNPLFSGSSVTPGMIRFSLQNSRPPGQAYASDGAPA